MNKTELVAAMAKETNLSKKDVEAVLKARELPEREEILRLVRP